MPTKSTGWKDDKVRRTVIEGTFGQNIPIVEAKADLNIQLTPASIKTGIENAKRGHIAKGCAISNECARLYGEQALVTRTLAYVPMVVKGKKVICRYILSAEAKRYTQANDRHVELVDTVVVLKAPSKHNTASSGAARSALYRTPAYRKAKAERWSKLGIKPKKQPPTAMSSMRMASARTAAGFVNRKAAA